MILEREREREREREKRNKRRIWQVAQQAVDIYRQRKADKMRVLFTQHGHVLCVDG